MPTTVMTRPHPNATIIALEKPVRAIVALRCWRRGSGVKPPNSAAREMPDRPVVCGAAGHCRFDDRQRYAHARSSGLSVPHGQSLRLLFPGVALILDGCDAGMELTGIDGGLQEQVLGGRELLTQLVVLRGQGEEQRRQFVAHGTGHGVALESGGAHLSDPLRGVDAV